MVNNTARKILGTNLAKYVLEQPNQLVAFTPEVQNIAGRYAPIFNDISKSTKSRTEAKRVLNNLYAQMPDEINRTALLMQT
jgi:DNA-binding transcriptional regulator YbjK